MATLLAALVAAPVSLGANRKIAIGHFRWSESEVHVDLGEHVTWYWTGPDTQHSVTGLSANARGWDSDPGREPGHRPGDSYRIAFDHPGTYDFTCKLHGIVRGTVVVSSAPGNPAHEADPTPRSDIDLTPPTFAGVRLAERGRRLKFALDERSSLDLEISRIGRHGRRRYATFATARGHIGYNDVAFRPQRRLPPGRYVAEAWATDRHHNESRHRWFRFRV